MHILKPISPLATETPTIKAIWIGTGAGNIFTDIRACYPEIDFMSKQMIVADTDLTALSRNRAAENCLLGRAGLGSGRDYDYSRKMAIESIPALISAIEGTTLLFIVACMGGGTGSAVSSLVAELAKSLGITTIGVVTLPFNFECKSKDNVDRGISELRRHVDSLIIIPNEICSKFVADDEPMNNAFAAIDGIIQGVVFDLSSAIVAPVLNNSGGPRIKSALTSKKPGTAFSVTQENGERAHSAAEKIVQFCYSELDALVTTQAVLVISATESTLTVAEVQAATEVVRANLPKGCGLEVAVTHEPLVDNQLRLTLIVF